MILCSVSCLSADLAAQAASFDQAADRVIRQAVTGKVDVPAAQQELARMVVTAAWFAEQYKAKFPKGAKVMDFMTAQKDSLAGMALADIDANFEAEAINKAHGKDFGLDLTEEDNEHFGNPIDLFVHPATASIALGMWSKDPKPELLKRAISELQEVKEHCQKVVAQLSK
jgi:hypothetical protein